MKMKELLFKGEKQLQSSGKESAKTDALLLLCFLSGMDRTKLFLAYENEAPEILAGNYMSIIEKRAAGVPVQHIIGSTGFMGLEFKVSPDVLIPRPETELLVEEALKILTPDARVLELCTGSGCIALSIMKLFPGLTMVASDISRSAVELAMENAEALGVPMGDGPGRIEFRIGDLFEHITGKFDLILVNPPYIRTEEIKNLQEEVRDHDPRIALDGGPDGLFFYRRLIHESGSFLNPGGRLLMEIGHDQADDIKAIASGIFKNIRVIKDYGGNDRIIRLEA